MNFYAYIPRNDGSEPMGTSDKIVSRDKYKSFGTFWHYCLGYDMRYRIFSFSDLYDINTFELVKKEGIF